MTTSGRHDMHRHPRVEQQRLVRAAKVVQPQSGEAEPGSFADKFLGRVPGVAELGEAEAFSRRRRPWKHEGVRQVDRRAIRYASEDVGMALAFGREKGEQVVVNGNRPFPSLRLRTLDPQSVLVRLLDRALVKLPAPILTFGWVSLLAADLNFGLLSAS